MGGNFKAVLFDLNGTIIDDMGFHAKAWHELLTQDLGVKISMEEVWKQMYGKNRELFIRVLGENAMTEKEMTYWSLEKEKRYQQVYINHIKPIPGFMDFLENLKTKGYKIGIGSAAIPFNINFVLDTLNIRTYFDCIVSADDVTNSKPDPETFARGAELLGMAPGECIVFEDAPKGVEAAANAGMQAVVLTTMHSKEDFEYLENVFTVIKDYNEPSLDFF
ncbi:MAG: HAD family phosphatase [Mongoliibacter sp.]|uniref:HAD family hydrolase n=1 Tax=Mongoliibacter sp. TaxID=2022438 RepID=UPI0012F03F2B|nr:HAD family phosphatase [Mongoliibacter sp.]TVP44374.1 MAG: HAD family phosphatase [Mongoliibacter sp.]